MNDKQRQLALHAGLFLLTLVTTTLAGAEWMFGRLLFFSDPPMTWNDFVQGFQFSLPFLIILTCHEFGHYFTARYYKINVTLPYYFPLWLGFLAMPSFGTMGAFIRIKEHISSLKEYFDVGVAGPLAGFVVAIGCIWFGFTHLPEPEYIFQIHPEYEQFGLDYADHVYKDKESISIRFGDNLVYWFFSNYVVEDKERLPHPNEVIHYPMLLAGYLSLLFTALNLLPIGQLDGGHIIFGLFGPGRHAIISKVLFTILLFYAGLGYINIGLLEDESILGSGIFLLYLIGFLFFLYLCAFSMFESKQDRLMYAAVMLTIQFAVSFFFRVEGYSGWLLFSLLIGRFLGVQHPPVRHVEKLSPGRQVLGWIALIIFVISFSPEPLILEVPGE